MAIAMLTLYYKSEDRSCIKTSRQSTKLPTEEENIQDFHDADFMILKNEAHISSPKFKSTIRTHLFFFIFIILFLNFTELLDLCSRNMTGVAPGIFRRGS